MQNAKVLERPPSAVSGGERATRLEGLGPLQVRLETWEDVFCEPTVWPAGCSLFQQGQAARQVYLLRTGLTKLTCSGPAGTEMIVDLLSGPTILGAAGVVTGGAHSMAAVTADSCTVSFCSRSTFLAAVRERDDLAADFERLLSEFVAVLASRVATIALAPAEERFLQMLRSCCATTKERPGLPVRIALPLKQCEVARYLGMTPEHLSRIVSRLIRRGTIATRNGWLIVPDPAKLGA